jgi:hypothetical protein
VGCLDRDFNNFCGVTDERQFSKDDLVIYGHLSRTASPIYKIKYATHPYYRKFYEAYLKNFGDWFYSDRNEKKTAYSKPDLSIQDQDQPVSFGEFVSNVPILFYKDPIGRWIQLLHREFLPPAFCEPVIYLYPTHTTMVNVRVEPPGGVTESAPSYSEGWNVLAHPDGKLSVNGSNLSADYLFWEGHSFLFPMCPQGVVVARDSVKAYLDGALPSLGLSKSEALDFERAWLFKLQEKSFCFITFYCGDSVEKMAPLEIQPKPDTVMRILMDFRPLDHWVSVSEPAPFSHVDRHGFTVVEWGGLER